MTSLRSSDRSASAGCSAAPFTYLRKSKPASLGYYEVPPDVLEDPNDLRDWSEKAFAVALAAARAKPAKRRRAKGIS